MGNFMKKSVFMVLLLLLGIAIPTFAQLKVTLNMSSRPDPYLSNWAQRKETVIVTVINSGSTSIRAKFDCKINKDGSLIVNTKPEKMKILDIPSGVSQYYGEDLVPFEAAKIKDGADQTAIKTGMLPAGSYEFCCALLDPQDKQLTAPVCKSCTLQSYQAPVLLQPEDKSILAQNKRPMFRWTGISPRPQFPIKYRLQVFEVLPGQTPINAFRANRPILDRGDIMATQFQWPADVEMPSPKLQHIWTVRALDDKDNSIGEPYGYATPFVIEPCCLKYGDVCCPPDDVTDNGGGNNFNDKGTGSGTGSGTGTGNGSVTSSDKGSDISTNKRIPIAGTSGKGLGTSNRDSISGDSKLVSVEKASKKSSSHLRNSILSSFISMPESMGFAFNPADVFTLKTKKGSEQYTAVKKEHYEAACKAKVSYMVPEGFAVGVPEPKTFQPSDPSVALFWKLYQNQQGDYVGFPLSLFLSPNGDKQINAAMRKNGGGNDDKKCARKFVYRNLPLDMGSGLTPIPDTDLELVPLHWGYDAWNCRILVHDFIKLPVSNEESNSQDSIRLLYDAGDVAGYAIEIIGTTDPVVLDDKKVSKNYVDGFGMVVVERDFAISTEEASALLSGLFAQSKKYEFKKSDKIKVGTVGKSSTSLSNNEVRSLVGSLVDVDIITEAKINGSSKNRYSLYVKFINASTKKTDAIVFDSLIVNKGDLYLYPLGPKLDDPKKYPPLFKCAHKGDCQTCWPKEGPLTPDAACQCGNDAAAGDDMNAICVASFIKPTPKYEAVYLSILESQKSARTTQPNGNNDSDPKIPITTKPQQSTQATPLKGKIIKASTNPSGALLASKSDVKILCEAVLDSEVDVHSLRIVTTPNSNQILSVQLYNKKTNSIEGIGFDLEIIDGYSCIVLSSESFRCSGCKECKVVTNQDYPFNDYCSSCDVGGGLLQSCRKTKISLNSAAIERAFDQIMLNQARTTQPDGSNASDPKIPKSNKPQYAVNPIPGVGVVVKRFCSTCKPPHKSVQLNNTDIAAFIQAAEGLRQKVVVSEVGIITGPESPSLSISYTTATGASASTTLDIIGFNGEPTLSSCQAPPVKGIGVVVKKNPGGSACFTIPGVETEGSDESTQSTPQSKEGPVIITLNGDDYDYKPTLPTPPPLSVPTYGSGGVPASPANSTQATPVRGKVIKTGTNPPRFIDPECPCCGKMTGGGRGHDTLYCCEEKGKNPQMHYTNTDGTLKYFEYKEDYVVTDNKVCEAFGVKELIIAAGVYKVEYPDPSKGGVVRFTLKTAIPAKQIKIKEPLTIEGTNAKDQNCSGQGNSCFSYRDTSSGARKLPKDSCIFTIAPLMPDSTCIVIEVSFKGTGSPKSAGF